MDIHFIHVRSEHEDALPLIMTHGWPGSVVELLDTIAPLTDPTAHGGKPEDAFHLVIPSLPGYRFSSEPTELGWEAERNARAWAELVDRLGCTGYIAQGGDLGAAVTERWAARHRTACPASTSTCSSGRPASRTSCQPEPRRNARHTLATPQRGRGLDPGARLSDLPPSASGHGAETAIDRRSFGAAWSKPFDRTHER